MSLAFPIPPVKPVKPWKRDSKEGYVGLTRESLDAFRGAWKAYEEEVRACHARCDEVAQAAAAMLLAQGFPAAVKLWTERGNRGRNGVKVSRPLHEALRTFAPVFSVETLWLSDEEEWLRLEWFRREKAEAASAALGLRDRAVAWLLARGRVYGEDFTADDAAHVALDIVAREKIAGLVADGRPRGFNGMNCDGPCEGWDGTSHRCECGNRRVDWVIEGSFEEPHVYGEAY